MKTADNSKSINSNHQVLYISAFEEDEPKSFSIKVAYPIVNAKSNNKIDANFMEKIKERNLFMNSYFIFTKL